MSKMMTQHRVVPDVIKNVPPILLKVVWANGISAADGNELTPNQVKEQPANVQWEADSNVYYTLCMTDPDAPSRKDPKLREWHHWLVVNIPGNNIEQGEVLSEYIGSGPPKGTGLHRYVLLVYKQPEKIKFSIEKKTATSAAGRGKFSIQKFAGKFNLGDPIAGNFFQAQWDDWVPKLYKTLGM